MTHNAVWIHIRFAHCANGAYQTMGHLWLAASCTLLFNSEAIKPSSSARVVECRLTVALAHMPHSTTRSLRPSARGTWLRGKTKPCTGGKDWLKGCDQPPGPVWKLGPLAPAMAEAILDAHHVAVLMGPFAVGCGRQVSRSWHKGAREI